MIETSIAVIWMVAIDKLYVALPLFKLQGLKLFLFWSYSESCNVQRQYICSLQIPTVPSHHDCVSATLIPDLHPFHVLMESFFLLLTLWTVLELLTVLKFILKFLCVFSHPDFSLCQWMRCRNHWPRHSASSQCDYFQFTKQNMIQMYTNMHIYFLF